MQEAEIRRIEVGQLGAKKLARPYLNRKKVQCGGMSLSFLPQPECKRRF
jgi:hypothetical protein